MDTERDVPVGHIQWHSSEEDGGPDVGLLLRISDKQYLWAGEITRDEWDYAGDEAQELGDDFGWWLIFYDGDWRRVLAKCGDQYAVQEAFDVLAAAIRKGEA